MKKQFYFLLIFICVNAYSQSNKDLLQKKNYNHYPGITHKQEQKIDALFIKDNKIKTKKTFYLSNDKEIPSQSFQYDKNGNVTEIFSLDEKGLITSKVVKEYDNKDNPVSVKSYNGNNVLQESYYKKFNEFGNEIERTETNFSNEPQSKTESFYDANNNMVEQNSIRKDGSLILKNILKYDNNDRLIEKYSKSFDKILSKSTYKYNSNGLVIEQEDVDLTMNNSMKYTMNYDEKGNLIENKSFSSGVELYGYIYSYDKNGNNVETKYYSYGKLVSILYDTFDENNNKIEEILKLTDGSVSSKTTYNYNKKNMLTETVFWNPVTDKPTGKSINKFEYYK